MMPAVIKPFWTIPVPENVKKFEEIYKFWLEYCYNFWNGFNLKFYIDKYKNE
jgi:hypothetical protein